MFAIVENTRIHYHVFGDGKPIIILHGLGCDSRQMIGCLEPIFQSQPKYKRIYIDLPGMGASDAPLEFSSSDGILLLLISMLTLLNLDHFLLAGESYGGYLARGILASQLSERVDGLFLLCPVVIPEHAARNPAVKNAHIFDDRFLRKICPKERAEFCEYSVVANERTYERYKKEIKPGLNIANKKFGEWLAKNYAFSEDADKKIRELKYCRPTLFITGRQDNVVGYQDLWKMMEDYPRASFSVLDLAGHNLQLEQPALFGNLVREWIARTEIPTDS